MNIIQQPIIAMPESVSWIVNKLQDHGYDTYLVGECLRDSLAGITPNSWNIATSASAEEVKALFGKTSDEGLKPGNVLVEISGEGHNVACFCSGGDCPDQNSSVRFVPAGLKEYLAGQIFTVNAMAWNKISGLVDLFGSLQDLERKVIRCIGSPADCFEKNPAYMLQVIRLSGQLNFTIDPEVCQAISDKADLLAQASLDCLRAELMKLLMSEHPDRIRDAYTCRLTSVILPEFDVMMTTPQDNPHHCYTVGEHTIHALMATPADPILRLTVLLHDIGKPASRSTDARGIDHFYGHNEAGAELADSILKRLGFDEAVRAQVTTLISNHDVRFRDSLTSGRSHVRKMCAKVGADLFPYLLDVMEADVSAQSDYMRMKKLLILKETRQAYQEILAAGDCLALSDLRISQEDLMNLGIRDEKIIEALLGTLFNLVLDHPELNQKEYLAELAGKIYLELQVPRNNE